MKFVEDVGEGGEGSDRVVAMLLPGSGLCGGWHAEAWEMGWIMRQR